MLRKSALQLLSRREHSCTELARKLLQKTASLSLEESLDSRLLIDQIVSDLQEKDWISDRRFAGSYLRSRADKGYGPVRIRQELKGKYGVAADTIRVVLADCDIDWFERARQSGMRKLGTSGPIIEPGARNKILRFLLYRGFDDEQSREALAYLQRHDGQSVPG